MKRYQEILSIPVSGEISLLKKANKVSVTIRLPSFLVRPITFIFDASAGPKLIVADFLDAI